MDHRALILAAVISFTTLPTVAAVKGLMPAMAEGGAVNVKSGTTTPIRLLVNCEVGLGAGSAVSDHGHVTFQETFAKACGNPKQPALRAIYTPNTGFVGVDDVTIYAGPYPFHFKVIVH